MPAEDESEQPSQDVPVSVARRDRDAVGRPRNARARDGLGRPQPRGTEGIPPTEDMPDVPPAITLDRAQHSWMKANRSTRTRCSRLPGNQRRSRSGDYGKD